MDQVIELDRRNRDAMTEANNLRSERNKLSKQVGMLMGQAKKDPSKLAEAEEAKAQVKANADRLAELEKLEDELAADIRRIMLQIPNIIDPSVPIGGVGGAVRGACGARLRHPLPHRDHGVL